MIGRVVKEVGVANVSDFEQRSNIRRDIERWPGELFLSVWSQEYEVPCRADIEQI